MRATLRIAAVGAALAALAAADAAAQQSAKDVFKGKVREGYYEVRSETDLTGVPGLPKEQTKSSETRKRCVTKQEVERGVEPGKDCQVKSFKEAPGATNVVMACKDGSVTDMKFTFGGDTFNSEMRITGTQDGKPFVSVFRSQAKHVGACPPAEARPAAPQQPKK